MPLNGLHYLFRLQQLLTEPTRRRESSPTLIDLIFTNYADRVVCPGVSHIGISHRLKNKLFLDKGMDFEVQDQNEEAFPRIDEILTEDLRELENDRFLLRRKASNASNNAKQKMVTRELKRDLLSLYFIGETVLVRIPSSKKAIKGKKKSLKSTCEGRRSYTRHLSCLKRISTSQTILTPVAQKRGSSAKKSLTVLFVQYT